MDLQEVLDNVDRFVGSVQTVKGILMENARRPYLALCTQDWLTGNYILLSDDGLFTILYKALFPHIIGGGDTGFLYPALAVGRIERNADSGICSLCDLQLIRVNVQGEEFIIQPKG